MTEPGSCADQAAGLAPDDLMGHVGSKLRAARKKAGRSQEQVASLANLHRTEIGLLERGKRLPRYDTLIKLAAAVEIEPSEFFLGVSWVPPQTAESGSFEPVPMRSGPARS